MAPISPCALLRLQVLLAACLALGGCGRPAREPTHPAPPPPSPLQEQVDALGGEPGRIELPPGTHDLVAVAVDDSICAGCPDGKESTPVKSTRGLLVTGRGVHIVGSGADDVVIRTNAGMGIVFDRCEGCSLENVTVTAGLRDRDANALDAAVVVRGGSVSIASCALRDNIGNAVVVRHTTAGIGGIIAADGARLEISDTRILRNSWNGILLLRGANASIRGCVIDGVDRPSGGVVGGGRGAGIAMAFDAEAVVEGSRVARYWEGIAVRGDASATIRGNVLEDIGTWGILVAPGEAGRARADIASNAIFRTGACGVRVTGHADGGTSLAGNAIVFTGLSPRPDDRALCQGATDLPAGPTTGVAPADGRRAGWPGAAMDADLAASLGTLREALSASPATSGSDFMRIYGASAQAPSQP